MTNINALLEVCVELAGGPSGCMNCPPDCFDRPRGPSMLELARPRIEKILGEMGLDLDEVEKEVQKSKPGFTLHDPLSLYFGVCLTPHVFVEAVRQLVRPEPIG